MKENNTEQTYAAHSIQVLEGLEAVRKRPAMYVGDTHTKGLHHLVWETVDNAVDEALAGYCTDIKVVIHEDGAISVTDDGRGIPIDLHAKEKKSALEVVMTTLHAGGKFDRNVYKVSGGLHGVGISCVNALSSFLRATVCRNGQIYEQTYKKGVPLGGVKVVGQTETSGTTVYFKPDSSIFSTTSFSRSTVASRLRELAYLNAGLTLSLQDCRQTGEAESPSQEVFFSEKGLQEFVAYLAKDQDQLLDEPIFVQGTRNQVSVQVAFTYNELLVENVVSYANNIKTAEGGMHVAGFHRAWTRTLKSYVDKLGVLEREKLIITGDDLRSGLVAVVAVQVTEPQFGGQTKSKLTNAEVSGAVDAFVGEVLRNYLEEHPRDARAIIAKVILAARARYAARKAVEIVQRKSALAGAKLPGKLADCISKDPSVCEIIVVEGDSAAGTAKQGRDRQYQAILPLRGKIKNTMKGDERRIYDSEQIRNLITALGVTFGTNQDARLVNVDSVRYHKIIIMADADSDGKHLRTLILTFFFKYMPELIYRGYVYIASPPLYEVKKGKDSYYCWDEEDREEALQALQKKTGLSGQVQVKHYKGLGEMNTDVLWKTTMDPSHRKLEQVTVASAEDAYQLFLVLMGDEVAPRRAFIEANALYADIDA